jgi:hypothetical protein
MSYNRTYQISGEAGLNTKITPQADLISDIRSIEGITIVTFTPKNEEESAASNPNHVGILSIKFDTFPFTEFDKDTQINDLIEKIRKIPAVNYFKTGQVNLLETRLKSLVKEMLLEKKTKRDRCLRIADRKFDKPSAYKSGAVVRCRKGDIWKDIKEEKETLRTWFKRQGAPGKTGGWVDCNSPIRKDGEIVGYKPCGRQKGEERAKYPSCRPTAARCKDKGKGKTWGKTKNESLDKLKETPNPQSGKAAPYGSGYAPIKNTK